MIEIEKAENEYDLNRAAELKYKTRPEIQAKIEEAEKALDIEALVDRCEINHQRLRLFPKK